MESQANNSFNLPRWLRIVVIGRRPKVTLIRLVVLVIGTIILFSVVLLPVRVQGPSMEPTYHDGSVNLVNRLAYVRREPQRGDVVAIRFSGFKVMLMKRIVGRPGETIEFRRGRIYINGEFLEEPYVKQAFRWNSPPETLGSDQYFVVGDNRAMRQTEHEHGKVDRERIVGKILL